MSIGLQSFQQQDRYIQCIQNSSIETTCGLNSTLIFECVGKNTSFYDYFCEQDYFSKENKYLCTGCNSNYTKEILVSLFSENLRDFIVRGPMIDCGLYNRTGEVIWTCNNTFNYTETLWDKVPYDWSFLFVVVFIIAGGVGNILVCLAVLLDRRLQNVTNYFLLSLAIADLLVSLFVMPLGAIPGFLGWALEKVLFLEVNINKFSPLGGSSYIKLPRFIEVKNAVINVINQDECCFAWAITSALFPAARMAGQTTSYPHFSTVLNLTGIDFPVKLRDISKFEELNRISVNVYGLESSYENNQIKYEVVGPLRYASKKLDHHVNLLLITKDCNIKDDDENSEHICDYNCCNSHYCWIVDLSRLVSRQVSSNRHKMYFCDGCLIHFASSTALLLHQKDDCKHIFSSTPKTGLIVDKFGKMRYIHF